MNYLDRPEMAEECGVFGVYGCSGEDVSKLAFFGLPYPTASVSGCTATWAS